MPRHAARWHALPSVDALQLLLTGCGRTRVMNARKRVRERSCNSGRYDEVTLAPLCIQSTRLIHLARVFCWPTRRLPAATCQQGPRWSRKRTPINGGSSHRQLVNSHTSRWSTATRLVSGGVARMPSSTHSSQHDCRTHKQLDSVAWLLTHATARRCIAHIAKHRQSSSSSNANHAPMLNRMHASSHAAAQSQCRRARRLRLAALHRRLPSC